MEGLIQGRRATGLQAKAKHHGRKQNTRSWEWAGADWFLTRHALQIWKGALFCLFGALDPVHMSHLAAWLGFGLAV